MRTGTGPVTRQDLELAIKPDRLVRLYTSYRAGPNYAHLLAVKTEKTQGFITF